MKTLATTPGIKAPAATGNKPAVPTIKIPFMRGAVEHAEPFYDTTFTLSANQQNIGPIDVPAYGFVRALWFDVQLVSAGNAANVAVVEDAPWSVFSELAISDVNGAPLYGPMTGYETYLWHKWGGFRGQRDPKIGSSYSAITTGAGATAGSGRFQFRINLERSGRDGLGALANMNASQSYKLRGTLSNLAGIFSTSPTVAPTVRVRIYLEAYSQPDDADADGRANNTAPPASGTTGYATRIQPLTVAGNNTIRHMRVGNYIRNLVYVVRRAGTSRANGELDIANILWQWYYDARLLTNMSTEMIRTRMTEQYDLTSATFEAAGGPDNGVIVLSFCTEFDGRAGYEMRDNWLPTSQATRLELTIAPLNAGNITIMTDDVAPQGNVFMS